MNVRICSLLMLLSFCVFSNAAEEINIDSVISEAVKGGNAEMSKISDLPQFTGGKCYRDGKKNGVVFEYVYSKQFSPPAIDAKVMKNALLQAFKGKEDVKQLAKLGVYFRFIYKAPDGKVLCDVSLSSKELAGV